MKPYPDAPARRATRVRPSRANTARQLLPALVALTSLLAWAPAPAQALRDPTRPPEVLGAPGPDPATPGTAQALRQLLVVDGRRYVVEGSRLRGVGDMLGAARIESIEDAAVVVRDAGGSRRLPLHAGVVKRPAPQARPTGSNSR